MRRRETGPLVLCYHNVVSDDLGIGDPSLHLPADRFERQIVWLASTFDVIALDEVVKAHREGRILGRSVAITFDDAYNGVFANALPVLRDHDLPATIFVVGAASSSGESFWWDHPTVVAEATPAARNRWLHDQRGDAYGIYRDVQVTGPATLPEAFRPASWTTIGAAVEHQQAISIGAHTMSHQAVPRLSLVDVLKDATGIRRVIEEHLGITARHYAYPYGLWSQDASRAVLQVGYDAALTLDTGFCHPRVNRGCLPRLNIPAGISQAAFESWVSFGAPPGLSMRRSLHAMTVQI